MIGDNLLRFKPAQKYLIFDCETCHLNLMDGSNVGWQWAWRICTIKQTIAEANHFVKWPRINIIQEAAEITGFYQRTIDEEGKDPEFVLDELEKVLYDEQYIPIAHNGLNFDIYIHGIYRKLLGRKPDYSYVERFLDTNALARAWRLDAKPQAGENRLSFQYKFANLVKRGLKTSAQALAKEFDIPYDIEAAHDAGYDVNLNHEIWKNLIYKIEI